MKFFRRISVRAVMGLVIIGVLLTTGGLALVNHSASSDRSETIDLVGAQLEETRLYENARRMVLEESLVTAVYFLTSRQEFLDSAAEIRAEVTQTLETLEELSAGAGALEVGRVRGLQALHDEVAVGFETLTTLQQQGDVAGALTFLIEEDVEGKAEALVTNLGIAAEISRAKVLAAQRDAQSAEREWDWIVLGIAGGWGIVLLVGGIATLRWVVQPIRAVEATTRAVARGDVRARAVERGPAELASLACNVNTMADALVQRSEELNAYLSRNLEARTHELEEANTELAHRERRFRSLVQNAPDMIVVVDEQGRPQYASPSVERVMGYREDDWRGLDIISLVHPQDVERAAASLAAVIQEPGVHPPAELRLRHHDGSWRDLELVANNLLDDPAVGGVVYNAWDVTERKRAETALRQSEQRFRSLVQNASDLITVVDADTVIKYQSPSIERVLGHRPDEVLGRRLIELVHPDDASSALVFVGSALQASAGTATCQVRLHDREGSWHHVELRGSDQRDDPSVGGFVLNIRDITERRILEEQLRHQAFHDSLTQLANRVRFNERLDHALQRAVRPGLPVSVLFMDIDNFKSVNDSLGHDVGDRVLVEVARRLQQCLRPGDTAARFGGDEFAVLLEDTGAEGARRVADRVLQALEAPFRVEGMEITVGASLGVAASAPGEKDASELLRDADIAMYAAKDRGKRRFEVYEERIHVAAVRRMELLNELQGALERGEFLVHYQPVVDLSTQEVGGVEALVRWQHPTRGLLRAQEFIPLAEESGVIVALGAWILEAACRQVRQWQVELPKDPPLRLSVNVSVKQLQQPSFAADVARALEASQLAPETLVLEITESVMMDDVTSIARLLKELKQLGVQIAIDDFGTGYSSLSYLRQFPFDVLKVDKAFVEGLSQASGDLHLLRAIIDLGKALHVTTVAEGIERAEQLSRLQALYCDFGQGYFFQEPASAEEISELLRKRGSQAA